MKQFFYYLALILIFMYISWNFYTDFMNYRNSYTVAMGGVFAEGMTNNNQTGDKFNSVNNDIPNTDSAKMQQQQQMQEQRDLLADNTMDTSQPDLENDYASVENPRDFSIFNRNIMKKVLASKDLIPEDINLIEESQSNYIRIGKSFIEEVSLIRNFSIPRIDETDYETLGRFVAKLKSENISSSQKKFYKEKILEDVKEMLATSSLSTTNISGENNPVQYTNSRTTGYFNDLSNALMRKKYRLAGVPEHDARKKYTDSYKPPKIESKVQNYDSTWSLF